MKFYKLDQKKPKNAQQCVIREKIGEKVMVTSSCLQYWYDDTQFLNHPNVVEWAPVPEHVSRDFSGWFSEDRGDKLPSESCECLVSHSRTINVVYAYFNHLKQSFMGYPHVVAFIPIEPVIY